MDCPGRGAKFTLQLRICNSRRTPGFRRDKVGDRLGLRKVKLPVHEGATGEFARLGSAGAVCQKSL